MPGKQAGFSLVEVVVGMALTVMVMAGMVPLFTNLLGHGLRGMDLTDRQQEARWVTDAIAQDLRNATVFRTGSGAWAAIEFDKFNQFQGVVVRVRYAIGSDSDGNNVLNRTVTYPDGTVRVNPLSNPDRGFVGSGYFTADVTTQGNPARVSQVNLLYRVGGNASDTSPVTVRTLVYPLNRPQVTP